MKGKPNTSVGALIDMLFQSMERLTNDDLAGEELKDEILRANAVSDTAETIISAGELIIKAEKLSNSCGRTKATNALLGNDTNE